MCPPYSDRVSHQHTRRRFCVRGKLSRGYLLCQVSDAPRVSLRRDLECRDLECRSRLHPVIFPPR